MSYPDVESQQPLISEPHALPLAEPLPDDEIGHWSTELFACHRNVFPSCLLALFCPILLLGKLADRLRELGDPNASAFTYRALDIPQLGRQINDFDPFYSIITAYFFILFVGTIVLGPNNAIFAIQLLLMAISFYLRKFIRRRFNIPGEAWIDCVVSWFECLRPCSIAQMARHMFNYRGAFDCNQELVLPRTGPQDASAQMRRLS